MTCCKKPKQIDLAQGKYSEPHLYCKACGSHYWRGEQYTRGEWDDYVNGGV